MGGGKKYKEIQKHIRTFEGQQKKETLLLFINANLDPLKKNYGHENKNIKFKLKKFKNISLHF